MDRLERILSMLDQTLNNKKKRRIAGWILLSVSLLFGGLAVTVMTIRHDEKENNYEQKRID